MRSAAAARRVGPGLIGAALALVGAFAAGSAAAANLTEVWDLARRNDPVYAAAVNTAAAGREKLVQGRALMLPTLGISGAARRNWDSSDIVTRKSPYNSSNVALIANQPLFRRANVLGWEQGELQARLADQQLQLAEQELMLRVARAYFEALQAQDALATLGQQKNAVSTQLAQARRGLEVGLAPITDVNEAQSRFDLVVAQEIAARNELEVKRGTLEKAIGGALPKLATLVGDASVDVLPASRQQELAGIAGNNALQVAIGLTNEQIARTEVDRQKAAHLPTLDLVGSVGHNKNATGTPGTSQSGVTSIGVEFNLPLYQGGAIDSRVREAEANLGRASSELENARRQATLDARQALLGVQSGVALDKALRQAVASGETQVRSTTRGLTVGTRTRVDVLNAEQQLYTTQRDLSAARYQAIVASLQLKAAAGVLAEPDLRALDALLKE